MAARTCCSSAGTQGPKPRVAAGARWWHRSATPVPSECRHQCRRTCDRSATPTSCHCQCGQVGLACGWSGSVGGRGWSGSVGLGWARSGHQRSWRAPPPLRSRPTLAPSRPRARRLALSTQGAKPRVAAGLGLAGATTAPRRCLPSECRTGAVARAIAVRLPHPASALWSRLGLVGLGFGGLVGLGRAPSGQQRTWRAPPPSRSRPTVALLPPQVHSHFCSSNSQRPEGSVSRA